MHVLAIILFK